MDAMRVFNFFAFRLAVNIAQVGAKRFYSDNKADPLNLRQG